MVSINGKQATVKVVTATTLTIIAPENPSGTYPVKVTVADKTVENLSFTYEDLSYTVATVAGNSATTVVVWKSERDSVSLSTVPF